MTRAFIDGHLVKLFSMTDAAGELGVNYFKLWQRVMNGKGNYPKPSITIGRREFYSEAQMKQLKKAFEAERNDQ